MFHVFCVQDDLVLLSRRLADRFNRSNEFTTMLPGSMQVAAEPWGPSAVKPKRSTGPGGQSAVHYFRAETRFGQYKAIQSGKSSQNRESRSTCAIFGERWRRMGTACGARPCSLASAVYRASESHQARSIVCAGSAGTLHCKCRAWRHVQQKEGSAIMTAKCFVVSVRG